MSQIRQTQGSRGLAAVGVGLLWLWQFCLFPPTGASPLLEWLPSATDYLRLNYAVIGANALATVLALAFYPKLVARDAFGRGAAIAAGLQVAGFGLILLCRTAASACVVAGLILGISLALWWLSWTAYLSRVDVEIAEKTLILSLPFSAVGIVLPYAVGATASLTVSLVIVPALMLLLLRAGNAELDASAPAEWSATAATRETVGKCTGLAAVCFQALAAYACISLCRPGTPFQSTQNVFPNLATYAAGFILGAVVLWQFTVHTKKVSVSSSVRLVFPIFALGVVLVVSDVPGVALAGIVLISASHALLESTIRLEALALVRMNRWFNTGLIALGLSIIGLGSVVGVAGGLFLKAFGVSPVDQALFSLPVLVTVVALFFVDGGSQKASLSKQDDIPGQTAPELSQQDLCAAIGSKYQLTPREIEVLSYLLEGRSHPFIRDELGISKGTVDTHVRHIYAKVGVTNKQELISAAQRERAI